MSYIYFCRVKNQPKKGYIGQDSRDISTLARIKEHIDVAYKPGFATDGCATTIRVSGCCAVEWAFFDDSQEYGLPIGTLQEFKKYWTVNGSDLDLAEMLHIVGSHLTDDVTSRYNRSIGGQNINLTYNWPLNDKYGLALQNVFNNAKLPKIEVNRWSPTSAWQKVVYPGQYEILKQFFNNYIITTIKDSNFLNKLYNKFLDNRYLIAIIKNYMQQYIKFTAGKSSIPFQETTKTKELWGKFKLDIEDHIQELLWNQDNVKQTIAALRQYQIHVNSSMFSWAELANRIQTQIKEKIYGKKRQQTFVELFKNNVDLKKPIKEQDLALTIDKVITSVTHNLYDTTIPLQLGQLTHSFFYKKDITPYKQTMPTWAQLLSNYKILWGITPQQQNMIFQWSRYRIYRSIDNIIYTDYDRARIANMHQDSLMARFHSTPPFDTIHFEFWTDWIREVLTAYTLDYKGYRWAPVEYYQGRVVRGWEGDSPNYITRDDLLNEGRPILYSGNMTRLAFYPEDTRRYY